MKNLPTTPLDERTLAGACSIYGNSILSYDDGFGPLWLYRDAGGMRVVVRAMSWEDALDIVYDTLPTIPEDDMHEAYGFYISPTDYPPKADTEYQLIDETGVNETRNFLSYDNARAYAGIAIDWEGRDLVEGYTYQSNASGTGIVALDLNGEDLREVPADGFAEYDLVLIWESED